MKYRLDADGNVVACTQPGEWGQWFEHAGMERSVAVTKVEPGISVSTSFVGIDLSHGRSDLPELWRSDVYGGHLDQTICRYTSHEAALAGHEALVARARRSRRRA